MQSNLAARGDFGGSPIGGSPLDAAQKRPTPWFAKDHFTARGYSPYRRNQRSGAWSRAEETGSPYKTIPRFKAKKH